MSDSTTNRAGGVGYAPDLVLWLGLLCGMVVMTMVLSRLRIEAPASPAGSDAVAVDASEELLALVTDEEGHLRGQAWAGAVLLIVPAMLLWLTLWRGVRVQAPPPPLFLWRDLVTIALGWVFFHLAGQVVVSGGAVSGGADGRTFVVELGSGLATLVFIVFLARVRGIIRGVPGGVREILGAPGSWRNVGVGLMAYLWTLPLLFAVLVAVTVLAARFGFPNPSQTVGILVAEALAAGGWSAVSVGLFVVVTAPLTEEIFFRGILQRRLRGWRIRVGGKGPARVEFTVGPWLAILGSALMFTLLHTEPTGLSPFQLLILVLGLLLGVLYERTGDVRVTFAVHAAHNGANLVLLLSQQG